MRPEVRGLDALAPETQFDQAATHVTTFRIGGPAWAVTRAHTPEQLRDVLRFLAERGVAYRMVGKGSNLLFPDEGYPGVLLLLGDGFSELTYGENGLFTAGAGMSLPRMANLIARAGIAGLEFSAQIPGSVGGSVAVNAGAFAQDLHSKLIGVRAVTRMGEEIALPAAALRGAYRSTALKGRQDFILTEATFQGESADARDVQRKQKEYGLYREKTQPLKMASAGCVFKNPGKGCSAGALIDQLGLKGHSVGDAQVSEKHANFIVNTGHARAVDVLELIAQVQAKAMAEVGIQLETEIELVTAGQLAMAA